jgi:hypothetical protein
LITKHFNGGILLEIPGELLVKMFIYQKDFEQALGIGEDCTSLSILILIPFLQHSRSASLFHDSVEHEAFYHQCMFNAAALVKPDPIAHAPTVPPIMGEPHNFSSLHSGKENSWGSLGQYNHCLYPQHPHHTYLAPYPHRHSNLNPQHPYHSILPPQNSIQPHSYSYQLHFEPPAHILQIIQHLHGMSPTKLKIRKTILLASTKIQKNSHM